MSHVDFERARFNMIEQQVRPWDVLDQRVLDTMAEVPREDFVPRQYQGLAFADTNIPIGRDQVMMAPKVEGRLLQALDLRPTDRVLEVGTGSGYLTALLARLAAHVYSVEIFPEFILEAQRRLTVYGVRNVTLEVGDAAAGWENHAPYDAIAVTGSLYTLPDSFRDSLAPGGRLFVVLGEAPAMQALLITRAQVGGWSSESLFETVLPPLVNATAPPRFKF